MVETANEYEESPSTTYTGAREPFGELPWNVEVRAGDVVFIPARVPHDYRVLEGPFEFLCMVPNLPDEIKLLEEMS